MSGCLRSTASEDESWCDQKWSGKVLVSLGFADSDEVSVCGTVTVCMQADTRPATRGNISRYTSSTPIHSLRQSNFPTQRLLTSLRRKQKTSM